MSYDQWKTASPHDDEPPEQAVHQVLIDQEYLVRQYGKPGHGMNGKDADLDPGGQFTVKAIHTVDPVGADSMHLEIELYCYKNVCEPELDTDDEDRREKAKEMASNIVCDETRFNGEWTGADYWTFHTTVWIKVPIDLDEQEAFECYAQNKEDRHKAEIQAVCERIIEAIDENPEVGEFQKAMKALDDQIEELHSEPLTF